METASINKIIQLFNLLSRPEQLEIADRINRQTFDERWKSIDAVMPNVEMPEDEIMKEIQPVRHGKKN